MATKAAHKRLTREYATITANPPDYIVAHPSETNILEWHYILTGPPGTPYENGQYWGTLVFPPDYPFAPPAIRMHTPSGRFRCSERLCLSISDFHPKSFNPAWEVSTILLGVLSFMTSEEMTTGSLSATEEERKVLAKRTRWWNSTGGGSTKRLLLCQQQEQQQQSQQSSLQQQQNGGSNARGFGAIKAGDGGKKFREQWPELDEENWKWMESNRVDPQTGRNLVVPTFAQQQQQGQGRQGQSCAPEANALRRRTGAAGSTGGLGAVVDGGREVGAAGQGWVRRNVWYLLVGALLTYGLIVRILGEQK